MDKHFEESYNPRLEVEPLPPHHTATGLINDAEFEGWNVMLEPIKLIRQDREDKRALQWVGIPATWSKSGGIVADCLDVDTESNVMKIGYAEKGAVREWDERGRILRTETRTATIVYSNTHAMGIVEHITI